jgi:hypothetical protein
MRDYFHEYQAERIERRNAEARAEAIGIEAQAECLHEERRY